MGVMKHPRITFRIIITITTFFTSTPAVLGDSAFCENVVNDCLQIEHWTGCFEDRIMSCRPRSRLGNSKFRLRIVNSSMEVKETLLDYTVQIPATALQMSKNIDPLSGVSEAVKLVVMVLNSSLFRSEPTTSHQGGASEDQSAPGRGALGGNVLAVKVGHQAVSNLDQRVTMTFKHFNETTKGVCVFWKDNMNGTGDWSTQGCKTTVNYREFVCSCDHLSFFAVLVNPGSVDPADAVQLSYISYIGSCLSVLFTSFSLVMYMCHRKRHLERLEHSVGVHVQLMSALLCLHLFFLVGSLWAWIGSEGRVCQGLGLLLHYALLATFSWMAIEGLHLYLLLVRIFNIYIKRYMLKLCLFGWGVPAVVVVIYGSLGAYGRYSFYTGTNRTLITEICWLSSEATQLAAVSFWMVSVYLGLVLLFNSAMLGVVVVMLGRQRGRGVKHQEGQARLWKDWATVLGLSCVLGLPWGLAFYTFGPLSLPGTYIFTVFNSMQGIFLFLWFLALIRKSPPHDSSSFKECSSIQKMETTNFT